MEIGWGGPQAAPSIYAEMKAWFARNMPSVKVKPFSQPSATKALVAGGGVQTTWFITDFMLGPGMLGCRTRIDDWR